MSTRIKFRGDPAETFQGSRPNLIEALWLLLGDIRDERIMPRPRAIANQPKRAPARTLFTHGMRTPPAGYRLQVMTNSGGKPFHTGAIERERRA